MMPERGVPGRRRERRLPGEESISPGGPNMATCEVCGNDYPRSFDVIAGDGSKHTFDSFECAIHRLAPSCEHCGCRILGHGIEARDGTFYCCASCTRHVGERGAVDRLS